MHRIVGLDVGGGGLRVVALESGFRGFSVLQAREAKLPEGATLGERVQGALASAGFVLGDDTVAVALPAAQVASHLFTLPFTDPRRIEQVLPAEVEGAIPFEMDEVVWDHAVLSQANGKSEVLVAVVRKAALKEWLDALLVAGIDAKMITFAPLALAAVAERGLLALREGAAGPVALAEGPSTAASAATDADLILDAGPDRADLVLTRAGRSELCRSLSPASAAAWDAAERDPAMTDALLGPLIRDLKITLRARPRSGAATPPAASRILLAGNIARLPGAAERLFEELGIPASPLALSAGPVQLPEGSPPAHEVALALGLALRAQQSRGHVNFRKGEFSFKRDFSQVRGKAVQLAVAAGVLLVLGLLRGFARLSSLNGQLADYDEALFAATKRILGTGTTDSRLAINQLSGGKSKAAGIPRVGAADVMAELISHLPDNALPLLDDLEVTTTSIRIKGTLDSFGAVNELTNSLKTDKCFGEIKSPRTEKLRDSSKVSFAIDFSYTCSGESGGGA